MKLFHTIVNFITDEWWFYSCCMCLSNSCCWCFLYILYLLCWLGVWVWIIATDCIHVTWEYWKLVNNWILVWNCTCICQWYNIKHSLFRGILQLILQFPWVNSCSQARLPWSCEQMQCHCWWRWEGHSLCFSLWRTDSRLWSWRCKACRRPTCTYYM